MSRSFLTEEELVGPLVRLPAAPVEFMARRKLKMFRFQAADESDAFQNSKLRGHKAKNKSAKNIAKKIYSKAGSMFC